MVTMMKKSLRQQRGQTLASVMTGLAIASVLSYYIFTGQQVEYRIVKLESVGKSALVVGEALRSYYAENCSNSSMTAPSVITLINNNYIANPMSVENGLNLSFSTSIQGAGTANVNLLVTVVANSSGDALQLADMSENTSISGNTVTYRYKPNVVSDPSSVRNQEMREYFGDPTCY